MKQIGKINSKIAYLNKCLATDTVIVKSLNPLKWIKFKVLQAKVRRIQNKNTDIKISRLEWKKELINQEIKQEARYFTIFKKLTEKKAQFEAKLASSNNEKKSKKIEQIINKFDARINKYQAEIDWINERNEIDKNKAVELGQEIIDLTNEMDALTDPSQKELLWYKKKIAKLTVDKNNLALGRNNAKLQTTIAKLAEYKKQLANKLVTSYEELQIAKSAIYQIVPFAHKIIAQINDLTASGAAVDPTLVAAQVAENDKVKTAIAGRLANEQARLEALYAEIKAKKEKYFPEASDDDNDETIIRNRNWFVKNWKKMGMGIILTSSFALVTSAYVLNNTYDLVIGNWGNYIDMRLISEFEKEYGVKVNYQQYDSNESLYNKNYTFNYDLMVPSDYMVKKLAQEGFLQEIDWEELNREVEGHETMKITPYNEPFAEPTFDDEDVPDTLNVSDGLKDALHAISVEAPDGSANDLTDYSLPWIYGDVRIVFNKDNAKLVEWLTDKGLIADEDKIEGLNVGNLSWDILWEAAEAGFNLALNNDPKNVFMYAFQKLFGNIQISSGKTAKEEIDQAANALKLLLQRRNVGLYGDELIDVAHERNFDIAAMYNGDIVYALGDEYAPEAEEDAFSTKGATTFADEEEDEEESTDPNIFVGIPGALVENQTTADGAPKYESTNIFADSVAISKNTRHKELAYRFINFMYRWNSQWAILDETGSTPGFDEMVDRIIDDEYFGSYLTDIIQVTDNGSLFDLNVSWDNYLVDKFNEIVAMKQ
ncbi:hypothetical protein [Spiroplasma clarkii]|nr:hypothetical protein [Spiroplasma clarkii]